jgi:hypothetical protein
MFCVVGKKSRVVIEVVVKGVDRKIRKRIHMSARDT